MTEHGAGLWEKSRAIVSEQMASGQSVAAFCKERGVSWQIECYPGQFERLHYVRKRYACTMADPGFLDPHRRVASTWNSLSAI